MQGAGICKSCYAGYKCVSPAVKPAKCPEGTYSGEGDVSIMKLKFDYKNSL